MQADAHIQHLLNQLNTVIVGKSRQVHDCVACLLAGGHLLIEDVPGVGKTTLAHALAKSFGLQFSRVQFTADLMPTDLIGVSVYERGREGFVFHPGPVFAQVLLADEINRASPKTQSALLEAMEEKQVTVEGDTRDLPQPFFVIATQNPHDQLGTYALPESQLDRFHMRLSLGYPDRQAERALLRGEDRRDMLDRLPAALRSLIRTETDRRLFAPLRQRIESFLRDALPEFTALQHEHIAVVGEQVDQCAIELVAHRPLAPTRLHLAQVLQAGQVFEPVQHLFLFRPREHQDAHIPARRLHQRIPVTHAGAGGAFGADGEGQGVHGAVWAAGECGAF